jgi:hypothetical protein
MHPLRYGKGRIQGCCLEDAATVFLILPPIGPRSARTPILFILGNFLMSPIVT